MALELTVEAEAFLQQNNITGNIILELDGFPSLYGSVRVTKIARIGEFVIGDGTLIGGSVEDETSKDYISLTGTTNNISQKLNQDRGGSSSVTSFRIRMIDKADELTNQFAPNVVVDDILGREATVYWQTVGSKHPEDSARLFIGIISQASFGAGYVDLQIQHPEALKRQILLPKITSELSTPINDLVTTIDLSNPLDLVDPLDNLKTYIRIDDEILEVRAITNGGLTIIIENRGVFGTIATSHDAEAEVESLYRLQGDPIELALRMMLSNPDNREFATKTASRIVQVDAVTNVPNSVFFDGINVQDELGLVVGDLMSITAGADASNLTGYVQIVSFGTNSSGSWVVLEDLVSLIPEIDITATCLFASKYNTLSFGAGKTIKPYHVDVAQFESLDESFSAQFFTYDFFIKDDLKLADFMAEQLFYPSGLFSLPRQGRISLGLSAPPILGLKSKTINSDNVTNATGLQITRSINQSFYNAIAYKYNDDAVEDKFLSAIIFQSSDSTNRINIGNRVLEIECGGIRETGENRNKIESISRRFLDRYQFGAETIKVNVNFKTGFSIEPGDTCIFEGDTLRVSDITQGSRDFIPRVFECVDRQINLKTGACSLVLQDTNLSTLAKYATFSPSSLVGSGSTTSEIVIKRSFGTQDTELERDKWTDYLLQDIIIRSSDHSTVYTTTLVGLSPSNPDVLQVNPPVSLAPLEDFVIEPPNYDESSAQSQRLYKALHCSFNPQVQATGGDTTSFTVADASRFYVGAPVRVHLEDYSEDDTTTVAEVSGLTITLNKTLAFSVTSSHLIDLIGFGDGGSPYCFY